MKTCLVVDDNTFDRTVLKQCALRMKFSVREAAGGEEALALCRALLPDCMLIDWEMEGMKGIELLQKLRTLKGGDGVCALICTSHEHGSFIGHAYTQGANGFISKPITTDKLLEKLQEFGFPREAAAS